MLIRSITLQNFQCYWGCHEDNTFTFKEGINFIVGDNGGGKSKLFDAFYWVLYDQIFHSDSREFVKTAIYKERLISDKAKKECAIGDYVTAEVVLTVYGVNDIEYRITRIYRSKKLDDRNWQGDLASRLLVEELKVTRWQSVASESHGSILERVIPTHLKPYMWFQGEQVDSLIDFKNKSALMQIINLLSDIRNYDELIDIATSGSERAYKTYQKEANKLSKNKSESDRLEIEVGNLKKQLQEKENQKSENLKLKNEAQIYLDALINQVGDAEKRLELKINKKNSEDKIETSNNSLNERLEGLNKKIFSEFWLLKNAADVFGEYQSKYQEYYSEHISKKNLKQLQEIKLPIDVPQPIHVNGMLKDERCYVCGQEARKGSEAYSHIEKLLNRKQEDLSGIFRNDCSSLFQKIYNNSLTYRHVIENIGKNIAKEFSEIQSLRSAIQLEKNNLAKIEEQFDELIETDRSEDIVKKFKTHTNNLKRYSELLKADEHELERLKAQLQKCELNIEGLVVGNVDPKVLAVKDIFDKLKRISLNVREDVFAELVAELESSANNIFQRMTERNSSITGSLKLKVLSNNSCVPEIVDADGFVMSGSNDSNIILIKLSLIMAIVTARAKWSENFCLISDAPTSKMAAKYSYGFYKALGENFKQSIVMTYDYVSEDDRESLLEFAFGSMHTIESFYPGGDRTDRTDLSTRVTGL